MDYNKIYNEIINKRINEFPAGIMRFIILYQCLLAVRMMKVIWLN